MVSPVTDDVAVLIARGRLADAKRWFVHRGWQVLPQDERGQRILRWGADHGLAAGPGRSPQTSVRRWCRRWARLTPVELNQLVDDTAHSNKRWSADHCAAVLEISVRDRKKLKLWQLGANDDPNYDIRLEEKRAKAAARVRRYRAKHSTGAKRGRPRSEAKAWQIAGASSKAAYYRNFKKVETRDTETSETENASHPLKHIDSKAYRQRYGIKVSRRVSRRQRDGI